MPIFAAFVGACMSGLMTFYGAMMTAQQAIAWARRTFIIALMAAFLIAVKVCVSSLLGMVAGAGSGGALPARFVMGLGMFIPSNAVAVLACMGSVWIACVVVRLKIDGLRW
ncbi:MAG: hypothetical protein ABI671_12080 [Burkholderiales bacterium]